MKFEGYVGKILDEAVKAGVVKTKAEALRMGILGLNDKYHLVSRDINQLELEEDIWEVKRIERDIKSGKEKLHKVRNVEALLK